MLKKEMDNESIIEFTNLSEDEINEIRNQNNLSTKTVPC